MRAKFKIVSVKLTEHGYEVLEFAAVTNGTPEDNTYSKWTPSATLLMTVTNPELFGKFKPNDKFYVDFTPAQ